MSPKLTRLLFVASMVAGVSIAPMLGAYAQDTRNVDIKDNKFGLSGSSDAYKSDNVKWTVVDGTHTVTPYDPKEWNGNTGSKELNAGDTFEFLFTKPGTYYYYCKLHGGGTRDDREGMWGVVNVTDPTTPTTAAPTTTTTAAPTTTTTAQVVPGPTTTTTTAPASSAGAKPPLTPAPAPTTTTAKDKKNKDDKKDEETTTTTLPPPPPPVDLPDSAIIPVLPGLTGTTTQNGVEAPGDTPEGDAIALLKPKKGGGDKAMKLLIVSGLGLGALGIGTAGYKYANRSSKYFPA